jgi:outer membrane protein OmpA-like peptidoglycan-associated protein
MHVTFEWMRVLTASSACLVAILVTATAPAVARLPLSPAPGGSAPVIPLCPGLTIVTAVADRRGDYESIKRIQTASKDAVTLHYSNQRPADDTWDSSKKGQLEHTEVDRAIRIADLEHAHAYLQQFATILPSMSAGTTAIGISADVLGELKSKGQSTLTVFQTFLGTEKVGNPLTPQPGSLDYRLTGAIKRSEAAAVPIETIVNDRPVPLPTVHASGLLAIEQSDFYFLDDPSNPLTLKFKIGKNQLNVVKIAFPPCTPILTHAAAPPPPAKPPSTAAPQIEQALKEKGRAEVYGIYFDFSSAKIRPESEPVLQDIANVLSKNAAWKLSVEGHTDNVGGDAYNLDLSKKRAAAVKDALTTRYHVAGDRLTTSGFGATRPKATNDTLEGRARNRRVELVKL